MSQRFQPTAWINGANIYEVNIRQYTREGTFEAFEKQLDRLKDMGVQVLWFIPLTPISQLKRLGTLGSYYATSNYTEINPEFGTAAGFKALVAKAHSMGFKVLIDWVANHTGWDHVWTTAHPDFYKRNEAGSFYDPNGWEDVIDLDYSNTELRKTMVEAMRFWIDNFDIDGFRCDMAHLVPLDFWKEARLTLDSIKKDLFWLAETEEIVYHEVFDASYAWQLLHSMEKVAKGSATLQLLDDVFVRYRNEFGPGALHLAFTSNHDENSHSGSEYERLGDAAKAFAVLSATWPNCLPLVYSGQELPNKKRLAFFEKDQVDWTSDCWLHDFYKSLLRLRKNNKALHDLPAMANTFKRVSTSVADRVLVFVRQTETDQVLVVLNLSSSKGLKVELSSPEIKGNYKSAFSGLMYTFNCNETFELMAWDYLVYYRV